MRSKESYIEAGKLGAIKIRQYFKHKKEQQIIEYYKNPNYCSNCGNIIPFEKHLNKCCCKSCSVSYANKKRGSKSDNEKEHISNGLKKYYSNIPKKINYCKYCGQPIDDHHNHTICKKYRIFKTLEKFGFDNTSIGTIKLFDEYIRVRKLIEDFYLLNGPDQQKLKELFNYTSGASNFHKILKTLEIQSRNNSDALKEAYLKGRLNPGENITYYSEWHTTWYGKEVYLRSSYEIDYANELDKQQIKYEVESLRIKYFNSIDNEFRCAIPDFYLPDTNTIVEIKSNWTLNVQEMKDKEKAYKELGYNFKLILEHKETNLNDIE